MGWSGSGNRETIRGAGGGDRTLTGRLRTLPQRHEIHHHRCIGGEQRRQYVAGRTLVTFRRRSGVVKERPDGDSNVVGEYRFKEFQGGPAQMGIPNM